MHIDIELQSVASHYNEARQNKYVVDVNAAERTFNPFSAF